MKDLLFNVTQYKEQDGKPTKATLLGSNIPLEKAVAVYKEYKHRDGYVIGNVFSTVEVELTLQSKNELAGE